MLLLDDAEVVEDALLPAQYVVLLRLQSATLGLGLNPQPRMESCCSFPLKLSHSLPPPSFSMSLIILFFTSEKRQVKFIRE